MKTSLITSGYLEHIRYMYKYQDYVNIHISYTSQSDTFRIFGSAVKSYNHKSCKVSKVQIITQHLFHAAIPTYIDRNQCVGKIAWSQPKLHVYMQSRSTRETTRQDPTVTLGARYCEKSQIYHMYHMLLPFHVDACQSELS